MKSQHPKIIKNNFGFTLIRLLSLRKRSCKGFTLIELLVTIAILGVLAAVATVVFSGVTAKARDSQRMRDLQSIQQALELYRSDQGFYPYATRPNAGAQWGLNDLLSDPFKGAFTNQTGNLNTVTTVKTYMSSLSKDPKGVAYSYGGWIYQYGQCIICDNNAYGQPCTSYYIFTGLENPTSQTLPTCNPGAPYNFFVSSP